MSWNDFLRFVIILFICISLPLSIMQKKMVQAESLKIVYNEILDNSVKDASRSLLEAYENEGIENLSEGKKVNFKKTPLNLEKGLWRFYQTLYLNLNIENDIMKQQIVKRNIPIKLAVGYDGYFISSWQEVRQKDKIKEIWHPKSSYLFYDNKNNLNINLTLDDTVYIIYDDGERKEFKANELVGKIDNILFNKDIEHFNNVRKEIILDSIQKDLANYSSLNNTIAIKNGWNYTFKLPLIDQRAIDDISFIAFLQGEMLNGGKEIYNNYALGIARIVRDNYIYGVDEKGRKYYHKKNCKKNNNYNNVFDNEREAAKEGFYPCQCIFD